MSKDRKSVTLSPKMLERQRIMSRMTPEEKKVYRWKCYDEKAWPQLLELIEYCQSDNRICPVPILWNRIYHNYSWYTDRRDFAKYPPLKKPLLLNVWNASNIEKRLRLLTQIYWCYKNYLIGSIYSSIMRIDGRGWLNEYYPEDKISLKIIKKEYSTWLGVDYHPKYSIWNYCENHEEEYNQRRKDENLLNQKIRAAEKLYCEQERDLLDDESTTSINRR
jgi:hypothetical protein